MDFGVTVGVTGPSHCHKPFPGAGCGCLPKPEKAARAIPPTLVAMARTIEFDVEALIGKLDVLQKTQLPYAGNRALWALKPKLRGALQDEMRSRFRAPVPLTLNSPRMWIDGLEMTVSIKPDKVAKGSDPASYLYPVTAERGVGGTREAYPTVATRKLRNMGLIDSSSFLVPYLGGRGVRTRNGRMIPAQYREALAGVLADDRMRSGWRYFLTPDPRSKRGQKGKTFPPGIYRVKGRNDIQMLFGVAKTRSAPVIFPFGDVVQREASKILPSLLSKALADALR
jgi:hypothetical protein